MIYTIFGSGFGLYGYLPALLSTNDKVLLDLKYRSLLLNRSELRNLESKITWVQSSEIALSEANSVIIATPPIHQIKLVEHILCFHDNVDHFFLEKPLAQNPQVAAKLVTQLENKSKNVAVGFLFLKTAWAKKLKTMINDSKTLEINWKFKAHHYIHNIDTWKRDHRLGGGALRFYGIHLIALLCNLGYTNVLESKLIKSKIAEIVKWEAVLHGKNLPSCSIVVDILNDSQFFQVTLDSRHIVKISDPFVDSYGMINHSDRRLGALIEHIEAGTSHEVEFLQKVNLLWHQIELNS